MITISVPMLEIATATVWMRKTIESEGGLYFVSRYGMRLYHHYSLKTWLVAFISVCIIIDLKQVGKVSIRFRRYPFSRVYHSHELKQSDGWRVWLLLWTATTGCSRNSSSHQVNSLMVKLITLHISSNSENELLNIVLPLLLSMSSPFCCLYIPSITFLPLYS